MSTVRAAAGRLHLAGPAVVTVYLAFNAGGFFPGTTALTAAALCLLLVLRVTLAPRPFAGWSPALAVACAALGLFATWALVSAAWSDAPGRALVEFDRALLYLLALALLGSFAAGPRDLETVLRWAWLAMTAVCVAALATRLLPATFPVDGGPDADRLDFPVTYWNALGVVAMIALVLCVHLSAAGSERAWARVAGAAAVPVPALTLYFTFSRGAMVAAAVGLLAYLVLARPRRVAGAAAALVLPAAVAVREAFAAGALARDDYMGAAGQAEGRHLLAVLAACILGAAVLRVLGLRVDQRVDRLRLPRLRLPAVAAASVCAVLVLGAAAAAAGLPQRLEDQRRAFVEGDVVDDSADARDRLGSVGNNGRVDQWRVALDTFEARPLQGSGAGTYQLSWESRRPDPPVRIVDGHSLYLEVLAELGLVGLALLAVALLALLAAGARRLRGPQRYAAAAFLACGSALLVHAGIDWDWEMPVLFAWFFAAGGVVAARAGDDRAAASPARVTRILAGLAILLLAVTPVLLWTSQSALERSVRAFAAGDCGTAVDGALDSLERLRVQAPPYAVLGYCNLRGGRHELAVAAMTRARERDPRNWEYAYGVAVAQAIAGQDPRPAARAAVELNPLEPLAVDLERRLSRARPERWPAIAGSAKVPRN